MQCSLKTKASNLNIVSLYRAHSADLNIFIKGLDGTLKYLYNLKCELLICSAINTHFE
jgi:hypothetical protein